ncbi:MAG: citrate synthase [Erysipelotrichia bacterium]|nr:citrate synthase [Erysipelotrichia bacterium]
MIYPDVPALSEEEAEMLCKEYRCNNFINPEESEKYGVKRGLRNTDGTGVLAGLTNVCDVIGYDRSSDGTIVPIPGELIYRGYRLQRLVREAVEKDRFMFEEVMWLLLLGSLPDKKNLDRFREIIESHRRLPDGFAETMIMSAPSPNIMNKMSRSVLAMYSYDEHAEDTSLENILRQSINLCAELPTMMVYAYQTRRHVYEQQSMYYHYPIHGQCTAEHILSTYRPDQSFTHEEAKLLDLCLVVHADHGGGNCSAFADRVVSSAGSDTYAAISSAINTLKGPKHGGANLKVMNQLDDIMTNVNDKEDDEEVLNYLRGILRKENGDHSGLIYGIGHAVYTISDPRAQILKKHSKQMAEKKGMKDQWNMLNAIERLAPQAFEMEKKSDKRVCANVDLFSGLIYRMLGIAEELYTPIFACARIPGWCAHRMEEVEFANRIIRPAYKYVGEKEREYTSLEERG